MRLIKIDGEFVASFMVQKIKKESVKGVFILCVRGMSIAGQHHQVCPGYQFPGSSGDA